MSELPPTGLGAEPTRAGDHAAAGVAGVAGDTPPGTEPVRLLVAFDGSSFHGFAANAGVVTVAGELRAKLELVTRISIELTAAGRTDAGVHGWGQVVSCRLPVGLDHLALRARLNKLLAPAIVVRAIAPVADGFDARFSARWRHYRYDVWNAPTPHPLIATHSWWVREPLDVAAMTLAAADVVGEHDFSSFCRRPKQRPDETPRSLVREVLSATWCPVADACAVPASAGAAGAASAGAGAADEGMLLRFEIRANAFCHQMVRSIVGTLVDVGVGKIAADAIPAILAAGDRAAAGRVAPPTGLTLWAVGYPDDAVTAPPWR